jgi:uncharacterized protein YxjI
MDSILGSAQRLFIRQVKEWSEILVGFEARNRFEIVTEAGETLGYAAEEGSGFGAILTRNFLGRLRPCTVRIFDQSRTEVGRGEKPFRWYFHRMDVFEGERKLGAIERQFSLLHRKFTVEGPDGAPILTIHSPLLRIWTFKILMAGQEVGSVRKKWGGVLREMFTDADTFGIEFAEAILPAESKKILLVAVFLVDFVCFENNMNRSGLLGS